ncbi:MAG TPA: hypothetical protein P5102_02845 [Candidatus Competibacteraceae bacterium]|nr:hypothetical protein [Candidatus Competibacteraceae bacterium]HRZ05083.1 hypothetical protein [Candidatus Competibacteraceae bacterium]HSA47409.1 hypothetical protein [Candidatus Competibacteraceae bacterium]
MKPSHHDKRANAARILNSQSARAQAADEFRKRHIDRQLAKALKELAHDDRPSP